MAVLKVLKYGEPGLRRRASPVGEVTPEIRAVIADMTETMYDEVGIGLAAPQVGISLRLIVIADEEGRGVQALLNPAVVEQGGETTGEEGCLSIPGVFAPVVRSAWVKVEARDVNAQPLAAVRRPVGLGDDGDDLVVAQERLERRQRKLGRAVEENLKARRRGGKRPRGDRLS